MTRAAIILVVLYLLMALFLLRKAQAHPVPLKALRDAHCLIETQHLAESEKDTALGPRVYLKYIGKWDRAVGRCQIMPDTAKWLAKKFRWDSPVDLTLREHSEALAYQRLITCRKSLYRRFGRAPSRSLSWCYLSGRLSLRTPRKGKYGRYLNLIARKMDMVRQNQRNWMAWKIVRSRPNEG